MTLSNSLTIIKRCVNCEIGTDLIFKLHYIDLQTLIFNLECDNLKQYLKTLQKQSDAKNGITNRVDAKAEDYESL